MSLTRLLVPGSLVMVLFGTPCPAAEFESVPEEVDVLEIVRRADASLHGDLTYYEWRMRVDSERKSDRRRFRLTLYEDRNRRRAFARVEAPDEEAGTTFLRLDPNLWVYVPRSDRILLVPHGAIDEPFLSSNFTHRDLLDAQRDVETRDHQVLGIDPRPEGRPHSPAFVVESTPRTGDEAVWSRVVSWIDVASGTPLRREFYDEGGALKRILVFSDFRDVDGRSVPHLWTLSSAKVGGRTTKLELDVIRFDALVDEAVFTTRNLKPSQ